MSANWLHRQGQPKFLSDLKSYVVFDTETTGLKPQEDELLEISALKIENGKETGRFSQLLHPSKSINPFISNLTGITNEMVADAPNSSEIMPQFITFVGKLPLVGHNVSFDIHFVNATCERHNLPVFNNIFVDTLQISRILIPDLKHYKLSDLVLFFNLTNDSAHRAWSDCQATYELLLALTEYQNEHEVELRCRKTHH